jgi:hypothetical protein
MGLSSKKGRFVPLHLHRCDQSGYARFSKRDPASSDWLTGRKGEENRISDTEWGTSHTPQTRNTIVVRQNSLLSASLPQSD